MSRIEIVKDRGRSIGERVPVVQDAVETYLGKALRDSGGETVGGDFIEVVVDRVRIAVIARGHRHTGPSGHCMAPLECQVEVGVAESGVAVERESVGGPVAVGLKSVLVVHAVCD